MIKESYERLFMDVTEFDAEDIITTSGPVRPEYAPGRDELTGLGSFTPHGSI